MPELTISHKGLELRGPAAGKLSDVPTQAFPFTMGGDVLESILACANNGGELQLELGQSPTLHFGDSSHKITPPPKDYQYDLYITKPYEFTRSAQKIPETMSVLFKNMQEQRARERAATMSRQQKAVVAKSHSNIVPPQPKGRKPVDSDIKTLQTALAAAEAGKSHTGTLQKGNKLLGAAASAKATPKSHPVSPGLSAQASPPTNPISATQLAVERAKEQRFAIIHELAIKDQTRGSLKAAWRGRDNDFLAALDKVADYNVDTKTYSMKRNYWKELDVWKYEYAPKGDRQAAIDNAIRQYNRMRLAHSEAQWQRLLPMEERGKGKHPSASKPATNGPAINNTKAQSTEDGDSRADTARSARSITPTASIEAKKSATDARLKQIISKTGKKAAAPKPTLPKLQEKVSARVPDKEKTKRVLSTETVDDSDSADEALSKKKPIQRPRPTATSATASTASKARPVASKPVAKPAGKSIAKPVAAKRPREDDEEVIVDDTSSSSSAPLSKRAKMQPKPKLVATSASASNPRSSDSSQASRHASANGTSSRVTGSQPKNTSPVKSSPLASSPPTNASDMEREKERQRMREKMRDLEHARRQKDVGSNKRKAEAAESQPPSKRPAVQPLTLSKASKFQTLYNKYYDLDARIRCMDREPVELVARLIRMRDELTALKTEIYAESGKA